MPLTPSITWGVILLTLILFAIIYWALGPKD